MKHFNFRIKTRGQKIMLSLLLLKLATPALAQEQVLTGEVKLACEAKLCLAATTHPPECNPALQRYFSIVHKKAADTQRAREAFLNTCPVAGNATEGSR